MFPFSEFHYSSLPEVMFQLTLATFLGICIGIERELARKTAGLRTYAVVSMGSALFTVLSRTALAEFIGSQGYDPSRIASQILVGIGFIGAGVIIFSPHEERVKGITTAASIWVSAAVGMSVGYRMYSVAAFATLLVILILMVLWWFEFKV